MPDGLGQAAHLSIVVQGLYQGPLEHKTSFAQHPSNRTRVGD